MNSNRLLTALLSSVFFVSCSNDDVKPTNVPNSVYVDGVMILNQGNFNGGNASISFLGDDFMTFQNDVFSAVNPTMELGDVAQDMGFYNDFGYVVVNNSDKIEVVNRYTMARIASITTGLENPRFIAFANGKGYVTNWGIASDPNDDYVAIIDLATNTMMGSIPVIEGPERIIANSGNLYVAHYGGYGFGNKISVINTTLNTVIENITVGDLPNGLAVSDGFLWVSCEGLPGFPTETAGSMIKIDLATNAVTDTFSYTNITQHISNLVVNGATAYYTVNNGVYKFQLDASSLPTTAAFTTQAQDVTAGIAAMIIINNFIFVADSRGFTEQGKVHIYSVGVNAEPIGTYRNSFQVGVGPTGFYYNE